MSGDSTADCFVCRKQRDQGPLVPDEPNRRKRHIVREEINPVEAEAIRDAAVRVLEHGESVASIARDWTARHPPAGHPATHDQHASLRDRARQAHDQELERV
jgi:hypothetical protein